MGSTLGGQTAAAAPADDGHGGSAAPDSLPSAAALDCLSQGCDGQDTAVMEEKITEVLSRHGISTRDFGKGGALSLSDLAREVSQGLCRLEADEAGVLIRHVSVVEVSLIACLPGCRLVLVNEEQILDDGRRRSQQQQQQQEDQQQLLAQQQQQHRLHIKLRPGEAPEDAARRALLERMTLEGLAAKAALALPAAAVAQPTGGGCGGTGEAVCGLEPAEEVEAQSASYPGLRTRYAVHRVELRLPAGAERTRAGSGMLRQESADPEREALFAQLGLPTGRSFVTVEGALGPGRGGRVHLWRWALSETDQDRRFSDMGSEITPTVEDLADQCDVDDEPLEAGQEELTPLEQADRDVRQVMRVLEGLKVALYERGGHLESQLTNAQDRLRRVLRRFANVESLVSVDTNSLFSAKCPDKGRRLSKSLVRFLKNNFAGTEEEPDGVAAVSTVAAKAAPQPSVSTSSLGGGQQEEFQSLLAEVEDIRAKGLDQGWVFDCLEIHERSNHRCMPLVVELIVVPRAAELGTSPTVMRSFTTVLHRKYSDNPNSFHNEAHASAVCHATHWLAARGRAFNAQSAGLQVATDVAALAHDVGHFGRNNLFCANQGNNLAVTYNDKSILENMHASTCFQLMQGAGCDILGETAVHNRKKYREHMVDLILATDMTTHFDFVGKFRHRATCAEFSPQENQEDRRLISRAFLKAADLGHAALPWETHQKWALRLLTEFYEQGDEERHLGLPISPMCDRGGTAAEFCESQKGFLQFVILPLFKELAPVSFPEVGETCITRLEVNAEDWVKQEPSEELIKIIKGEPKPAFAQKKRRGSGQHVSISLKETRRSSKA